MSIGKNKFGVEFSKMPRVYVAGKLNADAVGYLKNVSDMMYQAEQLRWYGFACFIPALDLLMGISFGYKDYHDYFDGSQPWLLAAHAVYVCPGWESSEGTKREIALAEANNIPVFYKKQDIIEFFSGKEEFKLEV